MKFMSVLVLGAGFGCLIAAEEPVQTSGYTFGGWERQLNELLPETRAAIAAAMQQIPVEDNPISLVDDDHRVPNLEAASEEGYISRSASAVTTYSAEQEESTDIVIVCDLPSSTSKEFVHVFGAIEGKQPYSLAWLKEVVIKGVNGSEHQVVCTLAGNLFLTICAARNIVDSYSSLLIKPSGDKCPINTERTEGIRKFLKHFTSWNRQEFVLSPYKLSHVEVNRDQFSDPDCEVISEGITYIVKLDKVARTAEKLWPIQAGVFTT